MPANDIPCKFDPEHGTFRTPVKLSQHYAAVHADVWTPKPKNLRRYRCEFPAGTCFVIRRRMSSSVTQNRRARLFARIMLAD